MSQLALEFHQHHGAKPFLKWAGGKGALLSQLRPLLPAEVQRMRYIEPFAGGAAMFFEVSPARAVLGDINAPLVATYRCVQFGVERLIDRLSELQQAHCAEHFYDVRGRYNAGELGEVVERAAQFVYLNKTCFNGLHRVNRRGHFNVPLGRYEHPRIADPAVLRAASRALRRAELHCESFEAVLEYAQPGDFVYFDPPYAAVGPSSFTAYTARGFPMPAHDELQRVFRELDHRGCALMLSNSDVATVSELYRGFRIDTVLAPRAINSRASSRGPVRELVVRNY